MSITFLPSPKCTHGAARGIGVPVGRQSASMADVMMSEVRSRFGRGARGHGRDREVRRAELQSNGALDRGAISGLDEEDPTPLGLRLAACAHHERHEHHCYRLRYRRCPHSAGECITRSAPHGRLLRAFGRMRPSADA